MIPTYPFLGSRPITIAIGVTKSVAAGGHPLPVQPPAPLHPATELVGIWLLLKAFSSGCTAMTGVEAVSNGVSAFREPVVKSAQRTLSIVIGFLIVLRRVSPTCVALIKSAPPILALDIKVCFPSSRPRWLDETVFISSRLARDSAGAFSFGEYGLRGLPSFVPAYRRGWLSSLSPGRAWAAPCLYRGGDYCPDVSVRDAVDRVSRSYRSSDSALRRGRVSPPTRRDPALRTDPSLPWPRLGMSGWRVYRWASTEMASAARRAVEVAGLSVSDIDVLRSAPGQPPDHRADREPTGATRGRGGRPRHR